MSDIETAEWLSEGRRVLQEASNALAQLSRRLDPDQWTNAVKLILATPGRVVVTGMGKSGAVGKKIAGTFASTGTHALFLHPAEAVHGDLGMLAPGDTVIALSYSGETDELRAILPGIRRLGIPIVAITGNLRSTLAEVSGAVLDVAIGKEACPMNLAPTTSTTAMIAMGDALAMAVMGARRFSEEDYAKLHPAGSLGRRLTLRVADVMRTGENVAVVRRSQTMLETLFAMTKAHYGAAMVVDDDGFLCGLITDGDIRRHLLEDPDLSSRSAEDVMNANPGVVHPEILAIEGLKRLDDFHPMAGSKAGEAPVVDAGGRPLGMLTLKELVRAGLGVE